MDTLPNGVIAPKPDGSEVISKAGVTELYTTASSVDTLLADKASHAQLAAQKYVRKRIPNGSDVFTLQSGVWTVSSVNNAATMTNLPEEWPGVFILEGDSTEPIVKSARFTPYNRDYEWATVRSGDGGWMPWRKVGAKVFQDRDPGLMHRNERQTFTRRRGGAIGTGGMPVVALRYDHGLANFRDDVLPHLVRLGLPASIAMNSSPDRWELPESAGVTPAMLNTWAVDYGIEVWNHGQTHTDASTYSDLYREIVTGRDELQAQVPSVPVEGWVVPGVNGTGYGGFGSGQTPEDWDTIAGRLILAFHGASTSHAAGAMAPMAGDQTIISEHFGLDSKTAAAGITEIDELITYGTGGMVMFLHPSQLDASERISSAQYVEVLEHLAERRDAGDIAVLTMGGLSVADQDRIHRPGWAPLLPAMDAASTLTSTGTSRTETLDARRTWVRGAVRDLVVTVNVTTAGTITIETGDAAATTHTVSTGVQIVRRPVTIPLGATRLSVTVKAGTAAGTVTQILDYPL